MTSLSVPPLLVVVQVESSVSAAPVAVMKDQHYRMTPNKAHRFSPFHRNLSSERMNVSSLPPRLQLQQNHHYPKTAGPENSLGTIYSTVSSDICSYINVEPTKSKVPTLATVMLMMKPRTSFIRHWVYHPFHPATTVYPFPNSGS